MNISFAKLDHDDCLQHLVHLEACGQDDSCATCIDQTAHLERAKVIRKSHKMDAAEAVLMPGDTNYL